MTTATVDEKVSQMALDLTQQAPRSPRTKLGGFVIAARAVDKCRSVLAGKGGEYHTGCPLDHMWLDFAGIPYEAFKAKVAEGASDVELDQWIRSTTTLQPIEAIRWNNQQLDRRLSDLPDQLQEYMERYIPENLPADAIVRNFFDVYDIEEGRLK